jgi:hypothetical protein
MQGDAREAIEANIEESIIGVTITAGYDLPEDFRLVTRELLMWDKVDGRYPSVIIQAEDVGREALSLGNIWDATLPMRLVVYFKPILGEVPATTANRYAGALARKLMQDLSRGGLADQTMLEETPTGLLWRDMGTQSVLEFTLRVSVLYEFDATLPAVNA